MDHKQNMMSRVKYYLLDFKDRHPEIFHHNFGHQRSLEDLTQGEVYQFFQIATEHDIDIISGGLHKVEAKSSTINP